MQAPAEDWNVKDVFVPQVPDKWKWNVGRALLQGDFPSQCSALLESTRHIYIQSEVFQKPSKLEPALNKVNKEINVLRKSYFLYDHSNLVKETCVSELDKKISIYASIHYFEETKENNQTNLITITTTTTIKIKFSVREKTYKQENYFRANTNV